MVQLCFLIFLGFVCVNGEILNSLNGPFEPVTVPLDEGFRGHAVDLPDSDPRVQRNVNGFEPEQISLSLSSTYDSLWISWITGIFFIFCAFVLMIFSFLCLLVFFFLMVHINLVFTGFS